MLSDRTVSVERHHAGWTEHEVRRMLRQLRRPYALELHPLARVLADVLQMQSPAAAVRTVIDRAFSDAGSLGNKLRELVYRSDIEGTATRASIANKMNLSPRQYFRYRKEAVLRLVDYINGLIPRPAHDEPLLVRLAERVRIQDPSQAAHIFDSLASIEDPTLRFSSEAAESRINAGEMLSESSLAAFPQAIAERLTARMVVLHAERSRPEVAIDLRDRLLRVHIESDRSLSPIIARDLAHGALAIARHAHAADDFHMAAREMRALAQDEPAFAFEAVMAGVESDLFSGDIAGAQEQLMMADRLAGDSAADTALLALQNGALLLQSGGSSNAALTYAEAARCALRPSSYERSLADVLAMRTRFSIGEPLRNIEAVGFAWRDAYLQALKARECLAIGDTDRAFAAATEATAAAKAFGFDGIRALGLGTLSHLAYSTDRDKALDQLFTAWELFLECGAATLVKDLLRGTIFQNHRLEDTILQKRFFDTFVSRLHRDFLALPFFASKANRSAITTLLRASVSEALELGVAGSDTAVISRLSQALDLRAGFREAISRFRSSFAVRAQFFLMPWVGDERSDRFAASFARHLNARIDLLL